MDSNLDNKNIIVETGNLESLLNELMNALNKNNKEMTENIMNYKLPNEYNQWKSKIENEFI